MIGCCNKSFSGIIHDIEIEPGEELKWIEVLESCPECGDFVIRLCKYLYVDKKPGIQFQEIIKRNVSGKKLFEKLRPYIIKHVSSNNGGTWFLLYNEFGTIKRCYSNLSSLQIGRQDNFGEKKEEREVLKDFKTFSPKR